MNLSRYLHNAIQFGNKFFNHDFGAEIVGVVVVERDADDVAGFGTEPGVAESAEALTLVGCWDETGGLVQMMDGIRPLVHHL
ncbi:hypothetical protein CTI12_AA384840 [Artemisia annua]|uniref:Uncharacterized protein n=1 Tax=Artemisia annua TaxID=35608 RepID=A0A2U1MF80_ARTAN|nr:hypothetical protein CTI12_AA384840 [Artemisia annua]